MKKLIGAWMLLVIAMVVGIWGAFFYAGYKILQHFGIM